MKRISLSSEALDSVAPLEVAAYLHSKGWRQSELLVDKGSAWTLVGKDREKFELLLPMNRELRDFRSRLVELLHIP